MKSKAVKRAEAEERANHVEHNRTKAHRLGRCGCAEAKRAEEKEHRRRQRTLTKRVGKTERKRNAKKVN